MFEKEDKKNGDLEGGVTKPPQGVTVALATAVPKISNRIALEAMSVADSTRIFLFYKR